jgi:hypothetical protein
MNRLLSMKRLQTLHLPLMLVAAAMVVTTVIALIGVAIDPREVTGLNVWLKPLKFSLSVGIYAVTLAWLLTMVQRWKRAAWIAGTVVAIGLAIEMVAIIGFAALGDTSHFNVSTPLHAATWSIMAVSISTVWGLTLLVGIMLFRSNLGDAARSTAIRAGVLIAVVGMGLAFLMTGPTAAQLNDYQGIVGAHTVGVTDGGAGLPLLGWSTVGGDLRIPHFVGMHALQVLPLFVLGLELLARRFAVLTVVLRRQLVVIAIVVYLATLALLTVQAVSGESIVHPSAGVAAVGVAIVSGAIVSAGAAIAVARARARAERVVLAA